MRRVVFYFLILLMMVGGATWLAQSEQSHVVVKIKEVFVQDKSAGLGYEIVLHPHRDINPGDDADPVYADAGWEIEWILDEAFSGCDVELHFHKGDAKLFDQQYNGMKSLVKIADPVQIQEMRIRWLEVKYSVTIRRDGKIVHVDDPEMIIKPGGGPG
ncbi:MAG: hypothetical protein JXQ27_10940 [Acidobacteria bacterium]|nr:hypothetical protein [Acidobacteriota bacterium]